MDGIILFVFFLFFLLLRPITSSTAGYCQKKNRPPAPEPNPSYPSKPQLALQLMEQFHRYHSQIKVKAVVADALYGQAKFMDAAAALFKGTQVISQLRQNQNINYRNRKQNVSHYFSRYEGVPQQVSIRGQIPMTVTMSLLLDLFLLLHPEQLARV